MFKDVNFQVNNIDDKINYLEKETKLIKNKDLNRKDLYKNKKKQIKGNISKNRINEEDIYFEQMITELIKDFKEINKRDEKNILNEINELKTTISKRDDNLNKKELNNLIVLKEKNKNADKNIINNLNIKIHIHILYIISKGNLKNTELLDYIENDIYFIDPKYESIIYRPLYVLKYVLNGIDLKTLDDKFFEKWQKINLLKKYSFTKNNSQKIIINKLNYLKYLGNLLKLLNFQNEKSNLVNLLSKKIKYLMKTYTKEECPNFILDMSYLIKTLDDNGNSILFMKNIIDKEKKESQVIIDIFLYLISKYPISNDAVSYIFSYFFQYNNLYTLVDNLSVNKLIDQFLYNITQKNDNSNLFFNSHSYLFIYIVIKQLIQNNLNLEVNNLEKIKNNLEYIKENNNSYIALINNSNNDALNEIIISIFENKFNSYFDSISSLSDEDLEEYFPHYFEYLNIYNKENPTSIFLDKSLEIFKSCLDFLERIFISRIENKKVQFNNEHICQLYCISYIKMYLYKCIYFNHNMNQYFSGFDEIIKTIEGSNKNNFRKIIKIYVFKIFFYLLNNNYKDFVNYHYPNHQIAFFEEFKEKFSQKNESMLNYYLLPNGEEYKKYQEELEIFESYRFNDFNNSVKKFKSFIENNGIDIFYTISSNIIISNLALRNSNEYLNYSSFINNLFDIKLKIPQITKNLFLLFSNNETFNKIIEPKLLNEEGKEINSTSFEILLYALRICLQTSNIQKPQGLLYSELTY